MNTPQYLAIGRRTTVALQIRTCGLVLVALVATHAFGQVLVNDTFSDTDRIGGTNGSSTTTSSPLISTPTSTNTQWVVNGTSQMTASASGMLWTMNSTSNRMAIGYFPAVSIGANEVTFALTFTTGASGATANNLRVALLDSSPSGQRTTDGFGSTDATSVNDTGYAVFSSGSNVGGGNTTNLALNSYERVTTSSNDLLGTASVWGSSLASSSGATGYLAPNTSYTLSFKLTNNAGTLTFGTSITGGNFSGMNYSFADSTSPTTSFDAIAIRLGGGSNQFSNLNLTSFTVTAIPEPSTYAALVGLCALGLVAYRRRQTRKAA
ncbi:MAG: PEP-CTERM sorting domain-containing protein [Candidatus Didemnitutus sp.]|nr:PEP-CTERM sorting domain-containing protein [Candidatus Didemnitutus sp.]